MSEKSDYFWSNQKFPYRKFIPSCEEESDQKQPDPFVLRPLEIKPLETLIRPEKRKVLRTVQKGDKLWSLCTHMTSWQSGFPLGQGLWAWMMYFSVPHVSAMVTTRCCTSAHQFLHTHTHTHTVTIMMCVFQEDRSLAWNTHTHTPADVLICSLLLPPACSGSEVKYGVLPSQTTSTFTLTAFQAQVSLKASAAGTASEIRSLIFIQFICHTELTAASLLHVMELNLTHLHLHPHSV